jgi:hypothetical protein
MGMKARRVPSQEGSMFGLFDYLDILYAEALPLPFSARQEERRGGRAVQENEAIIKYN